MSLKCTVYFPHRSSNSVFEKHRINVSFMSGFQACRCKHDFKTLLTANKSLWQKSPGLESQDVTGKHSEKDVAPGL